MTKTKVARTIRAVSRWRDVAEMYGTAENLEKAAHIMAEVERLLDEVGVKGVGGALADVPAKKSE